MKTQHISCNHTIQKLTVYELEYDEYVVVIEDDIDDSSNGDSDNDDGDEGMLLMMIMMMIPSLRKGGEDIGDGEGDVHEEYDADLLHFGILR